MVNRAPIQDRIMQEEHVLKTLLSGNQDKAAIQAKRKKVKNLNEMAATQNHRLFVERSLQAFLVSFEDLTSNSKSLTINQALNRLTEKDATWAVYKDLKKEDHFRLVKKSLPISGLKARLKKIMMTCENVQRSGLVSADEHKLLALQHANLITSFLQVLNNLEISQGVLPHQDNEPKALVGEPTHEMLTEFHVCGRKKSYVFEAEALKATKGTDLTHYTCTYCTGFHLGHASPLQDSSNMITSKYQQKHRRTWVRFPEKAKEFLAYKGSPII